MGSVINIYCNNDNRTEKSHVFQQRERRSASKNFVSVVIKQRLEEIEFIEDLCMIDLNYYLNFG
ncbi:MAG TPA: hypothetical protein DC049_05635 [Spirochaetia bacterium]|nr:hypothetical protein [Spirochaetia bacterium]